MTPKTIDLSRLPELPVTRQLPELRRTLASGHAVLSAEPGSGKTTLVPLLLLDAPWLAGRRILMLEPRRPAARMAARRMAALLGEPVGQTVGYQVRFERRLSAATRIEVLTEGLLLRRLQADPELTGVGLVVFDEFHERSLQADLSLALCLDVCAGLRDDLRLLAMSASLDTAPLARLMGATTVTAEGRLYPVDIHYADRDAESRDPVPATLGAVQNALQVCDGDLLVFLPGRREIDRLRERIAAHWGSALVVDTLYGDMPASAQDAVLQREGGGRRVILATDIAETSLTIEGIAGVVDSGLARRPVFDPNTGLTRLETRRISKASALQRAGRAGRLGPGYCLRAWTASRHARLDDWTAPEIANADLAPLVLELAAWGVTDPGALSWLDPPPRAHWQQAATLLRQLDALDATGRITATGRQMVAFPTHPRVAHLLAAAADSTSRNLAADLAALLAERDPLRGSSVAGADIDARLAALDALRARQPLPAGADRTSLQRIARAAEQLRRLCGDVLPVDGDEGPIDIGEAVARAYPDRIALCTSTDGRRYLMRNGRAAVLGDGDPLGGRRWLAVAALDAGHRDAAIWLAAPLDERTLERLFAGVIESRRELRWDAALDDVVARAVRRLDALVMSDEPMALHPDDPTGPILCAQIRRQGLAAFFDDPVELRARVQRMRALEPGEGWPDYSESKLLDGVEHWLLPWLKPGEGRRQLRRLRLDEVLATQLGWERVQRLDQWLPTHFETPAGTRRRIGYVGEGAPTLQVPLQEVLGLQSSPRLAGGRVAVVLHLLSPAGRPLQVTADLAGFWSGAYAEVRKEMRGRYPKHHWPEDPAHAEATRFTKRRTQRGGD